jgi:hypothetical protein
MIFLKYADCLGKMCSLLEKSRRGGRFTLNLVYKKYKFSKILLKMLFKWIFKIQIWNLHKNIIKVRWVFFSKNKDFHKMLKSPPPLWGRNRIFCFSSRDLFLYILFKKIKGKSDVKSYKKNKIEKIKYFEKISNIFFNCIFLIAIDIGRILTKERQIWNQSPLIDNYYRDVFQISEFTPPSLTLKHTFYF